MPKSNSIKKREWVIMRRFLVIIHVLLVQGRFEILSLSGSFMLKETGGTRSRSGGMSISLASPDGRVFGGGVDGLLVAASPVQVWGFLQFFHALRLMKKIDMACCLWRHVSAKKSSYCVRTIFRFRRVWLFDFLGNSLNIISFLLIHVNSHISSFLWLYYIKVLRQNSIRLQFTSQFS